ncbi:MAG: CRISPR-associated endonuclease Cas2 [Spirochaetia bacterium]|jgi:CRISPR-associated protein Cas2|nr:CRISPR-associated endonuclease Cas2 [Spirochaetia bacterium]
MLIVSYDISDDKIRTKFSKFLRMYGRRLQFSVYEIENSERILQNVHLEIKNNFEKLFTEADSVFIFDLKNNRVKRYGYALHEESNFIIF